MKKKLQQLAAFIILVAGVSTLILLTMARSNRCINPVAYLLGTAIVAIATYIDAWWIDKHFVNGEWV